MNYDAIILGIGASAVACDKAPLSRGKNLDVCILQARMKRIFDIWKFESHSSDNSNLKPFTCLGFGGHGGLWHRVSARIGGVDFECRPEIILEFNR